MPQTEPNEIGKPIIGTDEATIDDKGRVLVSVKKRRRLGDSFAMYLGDTGSIYALPGKKWQEICQILEKCDPTNQGAMDYTRMVMGTAEDDLEFDPQGRVVIPRKLRELAKLKDKVLLIGCGPRLEIWAAEEHARYELEKGSQDQGRQKKMQEAYKDMKGL